LNGVEREIRVPLVQSFAFRDGDTFGLVLFNLSLEDVLTVELHLPGGAPVDPEGFRIAPASLSDDNEESINVVIEPVPTERLSNPATLDLPPHSLTGFMWRTS
jgi:hypothetical protein